MAIDSFTDTSVATVAMLANAAACADLAAVADDDAVVRTVVTWPSPPGTIPQQVYPLLAVYRVSEGWQQQGQHDAVSSSIFRLEYWAPLTPNDRAEQRWRMLHQVWRAMAKAIQAGWHPGHESGALVFSQANIRAELGATNRVTYSLGAPSSGGVYPHFVADVTITEFIADDVGVVDISGLADFEMARMQIDLHDETPPAGTPTINQRVEVEGYREGFDLTTQGDESLTLQGDGDQLETQ